ADAVNRRGLIPRRRIRRYQLKIHSETLFRKGSIFSLLFPVFSLLFCTFLPTSFSSFSHRRVRSGTHFSLVNQRNLVFFATFR
ncbi:MAG: hypothetical protein IJT51_10510, partial [Bacteroidales bacterium]|nr:hypothetical protein [Bacteroidales bacterium]